ncbi:MAG: hypothetical protein MZV70_39795 [Desulfobacterales bacterium]|nr:hypothetical protein [Desulfobacterales bacterium]
MNGRRRHRYAPSLPAPQRLPREGHRRAARHGLGPLQRSPRPGQARGRGLLRLHFLRNESVHLYTRVQSVTVPQPDRAQASVLVAMAGVPITSKSSCRRCAPTCTASTSTSRSRTATGAWSAPSGAAPRLGELVGR